MWSASRLVFLYIIWKSVKQKLDADRKCPEIWSSYVSETGCLDLFPNMMNWLVFWTWEVLQNRQKKFCSSETNQRAYIICGDLDHLKEINDTWGHPAGNFALQSVARILGGCLRSQDTLARVDGDEFLILLNCEEENFQDIFRKRVKDACTVFNTESDKPFLVEISLGIVEFYPKPDTNTQEIIALADKDLYEAKKHRRKSVRRPEA